MKTIKVMTVFGTRPEAIKMAPLIKQLESTPGIESKVCVTAQHREMLDMVLELFKIKPDHDLDIMKHGQTISDITNRVLKGLEGVLKSDRPDLILVHGDTTTTFVGALAAFYEKIPVGHVEAGLRSGNKYSPYPEEMNRILTSQLSNLHFAPTVQNYNNLMAGGISADNIYITGNTVIDALIQVVKDDYVFNDTVLDNIDFLNKKVILVTCHRRENWGKPMEDIFNAIRDIVHTHEDVEVVFPVHLNPQIKSLAQNILGDVERIHLIEPLDYEPFVNILNKSYLILTDSGGVQEEAPSLGKPILVLRTETERPEAVEAGTVKVVGVDRDKIVNETSLLLTSQDAYNKMAGATNPYGDGKASERIVEAIINNFNKILL